MFYNYLHCVLLKLHPCKVRKSDRNKILCFLPVTATCISKVKSQLKCIETTAAKCILNVFLVLSQFILGTNVVVKQLLNDTYLLQIFHSQVYTFTERYDKCLVG